MSIYAELNNKLKDAMRADDELTKNIVRSIKAKISEHLVACRLPREGDVPDEIVLKVMAADRKALAKAVEEFKAHGVYCAPIVEGYEAEIAFCDSYIAAAPPQRDVSEIVTEVLTKEGISDPRQTGKAIGAVMKAYRHLGLDGTEVRKAVEAFLGGRK